MFFFFFFFFLLLFFYVVFVVFLLFFSICFRLVDAGMGSLTGLASTNVIPFADVWCFYHTVPFYYRYVFFVILCNLFRYCHLHLFPSPICFGLLVKHWTFSFSARRRWLVMQLMFRCHLAFRYHFSFVFFIYRLRAICECFVSFFTLWRVTVTILEWFQNIVVDPTVI